MDIENLDKESLLTHLKKVSERFPEKKQLKKNIEYLENGGYEEYTETVNKRYETYKKLVLEYYTDLTLAFERALKNSINQFELLKLEINNINSILKDGENRDLTIFDRPNLFDLPPKTAQRIYQKFLRGQELNLLFDTNTTDEESDLTSKVRALISYQEWLTRFLLNKQEIINEPKEKKLKLNQIALIYYYEGAKITRENADEIAKLYKHKSGESLYQKFTYYCSRANRKGKTNPFTKKKMKNKIELFESILEFLHKPNKQRALDEINILKINYRNHFEETL